MKSEREVVECRVCGWRWMRSPKAAGSGRCSKCNSSCWRTGKDGRKKGKGATQREARLAEVAR
jgi:hypothetical protein